MWLVRAHHWHPTARATPMCFTEAGHSACELVLVELRGLTSVGGITPPVLRSTVVSRSLSVLARRVRARACQRQCPSKLASLRRGCLETLKTARARGRPSPILMSGSYGLYTGCSRAPRSPHWIVDPTVAPDRDATVSSRVALSRYGSAGELPAWLPIVTGPAGHGSTWFTRPLAREGSVQALVGTLTRFANRRPRGKR